MTNCLYSIGPTSKQKDSKRRGRFTLLRDVPAYRGPLQQYSSNTFVPEHSYADDRWTPASAFAANGPRMNKGKRRDKQEQYLTLSYPMLRSDAWRSLSGAAVKVWLELRTRYHGGNNGKLALSLDQGAKLLGLGKATVKRALEELEKKGFVVRTKRGQWYGRQASLYRTTDKGADGALPTYAWKHWRAPEEKQTLGSGMGPLGLATDQLENRSRVDGIRATPVEAA